MGKNDNGIDADIFKNDHLETNDVRLVIFVSKEMLPKISKWGKSHNIKQRSKSIRYILRCCLSRCDACEN